MVFVGYFIFSVLVGYWGSKRNIGFFWAFIAAIFLSPIIGLIIVLMSDKKLPNENPSLEFSNTSIKYKQYEKEAKKLAFKEHYEEAKDMYFEALYCLENDYKNLKNTNPELDAKRQKKVAEIRGKIDGLKERIKGETS